MWKSRKNKKETAFDAERVQKAAHAPLHSVYALLHTSTLGLTDEEVEKRQTVFGKNGRGVITSFLWRPVSTYCTFSVSMLFMVVS